MNRQDETETDKTLISADDADREYRLEWFSDDMEVAGWFLRRPVSCRYGVLRRHSVDPPMYEVVASVRVPRSIAESLGQLKRWLHA